MTNDAKTPASPNQPAKSSPTSTIIRVVLLVVLIIMVGLLAYDYTIARPNSVAANEKIEELEDDNNSRPGDSRYTADEVHEKLGIEPSSIEEKDGKLYETYTWRRGILVSSYYLIVIYGKDKDGEYRFLRKSFNEPYDNIYDEVPGGQTPITDGSTDDSATPADDGAPVDGTEPADGAEPADGEEADSTETPEPETTDDASDEPQS